MITLEIEQDEIPFLIVGMRGILRAHNQMIKLVSVEEVIVGSLEETLTAIEKEEIKEDRELIQKLREDLGEIAEQKKAAIITAKEKEESLERLNTKIQALEEYLRAEDKEQLEFLKNHEWNIKEGETKQETEST